MGGGVPCSNITPPHLAQQRATKIKYLTDGVLLREMMDDPLLTKYRWAL